ncbi:hypothetical protein ACFQ3W_00700 [Paenibacillus puldeungensis]|uniref:Uncharacterized protein n=1 Tax=Paenibacillus puldeungensis TaxID=696536 RepID=A0ABW3RQS7_9BACL
MNVWAKACFELTDFSTHTVVSVVTNHMSNDANGCNIEGKAVWFGYRSHEPTILCFPLFNSMK